MTVLVLLVSLLTASVFACDACEKAQRSVVMYSIKQCTSCRSAKIYLNSKHIVYEEKDIQIDPQHLKEFKMLPVQSKTVPQIIVDGNVFGGWDQLKSLTAEEFDHLIYEVKDEQQITT